MNQKKIIIKKIFILGLLLLIQSSLYCQFEKNYQPLVYSGTIPEEFLLNPQTKIDQGISNQALLNEKDARSFYTDIYYEEKRLFLGENIYFNDEMTRFVRDVADKILVNNESLKSKIHIYVTRFTFPNAAALPSGTILINAGLIALIENEAQLAFIIAHEIAHYDLHHSLKSVAKKIDIKKEEINYANTEGSFFRYLRYSRENEFEADAKAIEYLLMTDYDAFESTKIIKSLYDSSYLRFNVKINYHKMYGDKTVPDSNLFKLSKFKKTRNNDLIFGRNDCDDLFETHPDYIKRIQAIKEILNITNYSSNGKKLNYGTQDQVNYFKMLSMFEIVNNYYRQSDFFNSLYLTLNLLDTFPDNSYLLGKTLQNLYWIGFYKEIKTYSDLLRAQSDITNGEYTLLYSFLKNIGLKEIKELTYNFSKGLLDKMEKDDDFFYYYASATESFLGKETAKFIFVKYKMQFPMGKYINLVKNKI